MSTKSTAEKLRVKPGTTFWSSHPEHVALVEPLPDRIAVVEAMGDATTAVLFGDGAEPLRRLVAAHADELGAPEVLWVAYPKGNRSDVNRDSLWPILAEHGLRPIAQVALDDVWSAMRFRPLEPGEETFTGGKRA